MTWLLPIEIGLIQGLIMAGAVLGFVLAFRLLDFPDLTVEASVPFAAAVYALCVRDGFPPAFALAAGSVAGAVAGTVTALLHTRFSVNKFLAGIIVVSVAYSLSLRVMAGSNLSLLQAPSITGQWRTLFDDTRLGMLLVLTLISGTVAVLLIQLLGSGPGIRLRAAGGNSAFAQSVGIRHQLCIISGLAACNLMAAFSGMIQADYQGFADVSGGQGVLILALAAMAIGEALVPKRRFRYHVFVVLAALVGSVVYQIVVACAVRAGLAPTDLRLVTGVMVLLVVAWRHSRDASVLEEVGK